MSFFSPDLDVIEILLLLVPAIIFTALIFLALREFWCWYFKLTHIKKLLEEIEENTRVHRNLDAADKAARGE